MCLIKQLATHKSVLHITREILSTETVLVRAAKCQSSKYVPNLIEATMPHLFNIHAKSQNKN